jgi:hypothetical protein
MNGLREVNRAADDERSSRDPNIYIARAKQVAANKKEWLRRANVAAISDGSGDNAFYIIATQLENRPVAYRDGHLAVA